MRETLTIRLTEELADALRREARESGIPRGELVRQAVAARLRKSSPSVIARYFGAMSGPEDLSTNKTYRRSWRKRRG